MRAYYNENDPFAAEWSRELIREGEITEGKVDGRSIAEVEGIDVAGCERVHLFAGIGGWDYALKLAGWDPGRSVWTGSCPCQPFSVAGKGRGVADERHLWPEMRRLVEECRPRFIFGEQVASAAGREWLGGDPRLQRVRDAEAVARVLCGQGLLDGLPAGVQGMLEATGADTEGEDSEGQEFGEIQGVEEGQSSVRAGDAGAVSGEAEGPGVHDYRSRYLRCDRCGRLRTDGDSVQPGRRQDLGQPFFGSDRFLEGVHAEECPCGALLRERDGEPLGREQDHRDSRCDHGCPEGQVGEVPSEAGICATLAARRRRLAGVRADLEALGYAVGCADLCAASVGSPTRRQRLYWVAQCGGEGLEGFGGDEDGGGESGRLESGSDRSVAATGEIVPDASGLDAVSVLRGVDMHDSRGARARLRVSGGRRVGDPALRIWEQYESVPCVDGWRRSEPGIFPLVAGISRGVVRGGDPGAPIDANATAEARVGRLKGYGNAIVPQLAAMFIRAFLDVTDC